MGDGSVRGLGLCMAVLVGLQYTGTLPTVHRYVLYTNIQLASFLYCRCCISREADITCDQKLLHQCGRTIMHASHKNYVSWILSALLVIGSRSIVVTQVVHKVRLASHNRWTRGAGITDLVEDKHLRYWVFCLV